MRQTKQCYSTIIQGQTISSSVAIRLGQRYNTTNSKCTRHDRTCLGTSLGQHVNTHFVNQSNYKFCSTWTYLWMVVWSTRITASSLSSGISTQTEFTRDTRLKPVNLTSTSMLTPCRQQACHLHPLPNVFWGTILETGRSRSCLTRTTT